LIIEAIAEEIGASALGEVMRSSSWAYPVANVAHLFGLALLAGGILAVDLRIMGFWQKLPLKAMSDALTPFAIMGLLVFALSGGALFAADAKDLVKNPVFLWKMLLVGLAVANALAFRKFGSEALGNPVGNASFALRISAVLSLSLWSAAIICGRMIAY
jgi:phosphoglycerol transferase MdoB-like AlkP superfamily enzyme